MDIRKWREVDNVVLNKYIIIDTHGGMEDVVGIVAAIKLANKS
jgi:hypothetical protein